MLLSDGLALAGALPYWISSALFSVLLAKPYSYKD